MTSQSVNIRVLNTGVVIHDFKMLKVLSFLSGGSGHSVFHILKMSFTKRLRRIYIERWQSISFFFFGGGGGGVDVGLTLSLTGGSISSSPTVYHYLYV